jgi:hypothetical protein
MCCVSRRFRNAVKPGWKEEDLPGSGVLYDLGEGLLLTHTGCLQYCL